MTPEGKVKQKVTKLLKQYGCWYWMPVVSGYGAATLDYLAATDGRMFGIETKAPGKKPTPRQRATMRQMENKNIPCFVIDGDLTELEEWLIKVTE